MTSVCAPDAAASMEQVGQVFQNIHRSAANTQKCRKELLRLAKSDEAHCIEAVCQVLLLVLKQSPQLTSDALRRHYAFLGEMGKAFREALSSDALSIAIMRLMLPYHNANEKLVRLAVVSTIEVLLRSVDQSNTSDERQEFYQEVAEVLKQRVHDRFASVREKAVIAISAFQSGKKDCDVAQHLIALLCTDNNADVRQQILHAIAPRKEFLEGYFHGMMRSTRDAVARVRAEAWDALGRFPWRYITAYAVAKHISLSERLSQGLTDSSPSVVAACRAAMTNGWLHRDCAEKCEALLDPIVMGNVLATLEPMDIICAEVLAYFRKRSPLRHFTIDLSDVHTAALLMWRTEAKLAGDAEGEDESQLLPPLEQFCAMLQDTVYAYARPDAPAKVMTFRTTEDADNMLRVLLSAFEVYEDNAYLAHADNTTRNGLLRLLNFLLKVVPDDDPALFVDVAVRSIKSLTARTPEEATTTVTTALDSLFRSLKLPQRHGLGFDDVEALARKSRERQQELVKRKVQARSGDAPQEKYDELKAEMDRDEKFLLRMQLIVLAFLSHSQRGDDIPVFCSHIIQLGRQQDNESVQVAATKSLGLQCLISPDSVHTFMPLLVADTRQLQRNNNTTTNNNNNNHMSESVPLAAMGVIFDLLMEYGLKFFDVPPSAAPREEHAYNVENPSEARLHHEHELAVEDVHKVGGRHLLHDILATLAPELCPTTHALTIVGLCKLLSCNRIAPDDTSMVLSHLLLHFMRVQQEKKMKEMSAYLADYLAKFCRSYAASHSKRQEELATAGVAAFRLLLPHHAAMAMKLMDVVLPMSDAYILGSIREIDPEAAKRANKAMADANDEENSAGAGGKATSTTTASTSARSTITRGSLQGGRLLRELSRCSLHERMAQELLVELAEAPSRESRSACLAALQRMYFYSVDSQAYLHFCGKMAMNALETGDGTLREQLRSWLEEVARQHKDAVAASPGAEADFAVQWANAVRDRLTRVQCLQLYVDDDARFFERELPVREVVKAEPTHGSGVGVKREREREDYFDVESIIGKRGGKHQR